MFVIIRIISAPIAAVLVCLVWAWFSTEPQSERLDNVYYFSFYENFIFPFIFAVPIYLILGLPYSLLIDRIFKTIQIHRFGKEMLVMLLYMISGILALLLFLVIFGGGNAMNNLLMLPVLLLGIVSAVVYYLVIRLFEGLWATQLRRRERIDA